MKYFYDLRRHFYSLLPTFANDMRYARNTSADGDGVGVGVRAAAAFLGKVQLKVRHSLVANACRIIKPKVISHRTCLGQERDGDAADLAKKPKSLQPIIIPIVVQWQFLFFRRLLFLIFGSILGKLGYNVPTMVSSAFIAALQRVGILSATAEATTTSRSSNSNVPKTLFGQCRRHDAAIKRNK